MCYIYCITNTINGKKYIGKTSNSVEKRFNEHLHDCHRRKMEKRPLYSVINKYGKEHFIVETIEKCPKEIVNEREIYWIDFYNTYKNGYNTTRGGEGKFKIDEDIILELYGKYKKIKIVHEKTGYDTTTIRKVLKAHNIEIVHYNPPDYTLWGLPRKILQYSLKNTFLREFESANKAANWLFDNGYAKTKNSGIRGHILSAAKNEGKAYNFYWKYKESVQQM